MAKILIAEDDAAFRSSLAETILDLGHEPVAAESGEKVLTLLETNRAGLALVDLRMRGMDGLEVLRRIKSHPQHSDLPVVILTAFADSENTIEAMKLGAFDHLTKPIGRDDLAMLLSRALARPRAYSQTPSAASGGDLGWVTQGQLDPDFEAVAWHLKPGIVSGIVHTKFGYHLIIVEGHQPAGTEPFEAVRASVREYLMTQKAADVVNAVAKLTVP